MAIKSYEGRLQVYWKGADFRNLVHVYVDRVNVGKGKRAAWRQKIYYILCESKICEHKQTGKCPMMHSENECMCPAGKLMSIDEPRKDTKMYTDFTVLVERIPYLLFFQQYSQFVWDFKDHTVDQDDYEVLKAIPHFSMKRISDAPHHLDQALEQIEEKHEYRTNELNYAKGPTCQFTNTLRQKYKAELDAYLKLVTMETFLDPATIELNNFKKRVGDLFVKCGEYVVLKIPYLAHFEQYGMQSIFLFPDSKSKYSNRKYNAVRIEDFPHIYSFLINLVPVDVYGYQDYQKLYVPVIKEQFPKFCEKHGLKFLETAV